MKSIKYAASSTMPTLPLTQAFSSSVPTACFIQEWYSKSWNRTIYFPLHSSLLIYWWIFQRNVRKDRETPRCKPASAFTFSLRLPSSLCFTRQLRDPRARLTYVAHFLNFLHDLTICGVSVQGHGEKGESFAQEWRNVKKGKWEKKRHEVRHKALQTGLVISLG